MWTTYIIEDNILYLNMNLSKTPEEVKDREGQGSLACCSPWGSQRVRQDLATEQQQLAVNINPAYITTLQQHLD